MSGLVPLLPRLRFSDPTGKPVAGGSVEVYLAGTTTPATIFEDAALTIPNTDPIDLDANGEAMFWLPLGQLYKLLVRYPSPDGGLTPGAVVPGWPLDNVSGAAGNGGFASYWSMEAFAGDATARLQALIDAMPAGATLLLGPGTFDLSTITITKALTIRGAGKYATIVRTNSATADFISVNTTATVEISDLHLDTTVTRTGGSFIKVDPPSNVNGDSVFRRILFANAYIGLNFVDAADFTVEDCTFANYSNTGIQVADVASPDTGDSLIFNNAFDAGLNPSGVAIDHLSSGGLRILSNKFLRGSYHILGQYGPGNTSILVIQGNSSEAAGSANIALTGTNPATFSKVLITGNQLSVNNGASGIQVNDPGYAFLDDLTIGDNTLNLAAGAVGITLLRGGRVTILPNSIISNGAGTTGMSFGANAGATVYAQNMLNLTTRYAGTVTGITFLPGGLIQSGTSTSAATATAHGAVFKGPVTTIVFPTAYPKAPSLRAWITDVGGGVGLQIVDASITATQFQYQAIGIAAGSTPKIAWEASGG